MTERRRHLAATTSLAFAVLFAQPGVVAQDVAPHDLLNRMASAVQSTNYEGTVIRDRNGEAEVLQIVHMVSDGIVREKMIVQEGNGLEIIRNGNEVHCILPDKQTVLVEEWNDQSTLFSTLPSSEIRFGNEYDVSIVRKDRVAGRKAIVLAIRPHDSYRYGHRIWLDEATSFPLKTKLIGDDGSALEQVKFATINIDKEIHASALQPSISIENFRWQNRPQRSISHADDGSWKNDALPPGFRVISEHKEDIPGSDEMVTHILYSDGLANVSVFIEPSKEKKIAKRSRVGSSNSYSVVIEGHQVTAVGEVPAATVREIAMSMQPE